MLRRLSLLPVNIFVRSIMKSFLLCHCSCQHLRIILFGNNPVPVFILIEQGRSQSIKFKAAAPFPINSFTDTALFTICHFFKARYAMCNGMFSQFHTDPFPTHFLRYSGRGARAEEGV